MDKIIFVFMLAIPSARARITGSQPASADAWCVGAANSESCVDASGNFIPTVTNNQDIGSSALKWRNLNMAGTATAGTLTAPVISGASTFTSSVTINGTSLIKTSGGPILTVQTTDVANYISSFTAGGYNVAIHGGANGFNGNHFITTGNHGLGFAVNNGNDSMMIDNTGKVGIGTFAPAAALDVTGQGKFSADVQVKSLTATSSATVNGLTITSGNTIVGSGILISTGGIWSTSDTASISGNSCVSGSTFSLTLQSAANLDFDLTVVSSATNSNGNLTWVNLLEDGALIDSFTNVVGGSVPYGNPMLICIAVNFQYLNCSIHYRSKNTSASGAHSFCVTGNVGSGEHFACNDGLCYYKVTAGL